MKKIAIYSALSTALLLGACSSEEPSTPTEKPAAQAEKPAQQAAPAQAEPHTGGDTVELTAVDHFKREHLDAGLIMYTDEKQVYRFEEDGKTRYAVFQNGERVETTDQAPE